MTSDPPDPTIHEPPGGEPPGDQPTIVGIGASAGGLAALRTFFEQVPTETGLVWVVVVHLSPDHESHLPELLQRHARIPVLQVQETMPMQRDHVYVIPPDANLDAVDTHLRLTELEDHRSHRAPIDHFFRTLAEAHEGGAVGVLLTGTGSDGTLGLRSVAAHEGLTVVQDPDEAQYDGMPRNALATGLVDWVLPVAEIPRAIVEYVGTRPRVRTTLDPDAGDEPQRRTVLEILGQVRSRTGHDFSRYKPATMRRRIARRMQIQQVQEPDAYLAFLRDDPEEARALADDLLITVTRFFRDAEAFEELERRWIPRLFDAKGADDQLRVWSVGCATGEETYSVAMLLAEEAARREAPPHIQLFASDLHEGSLGLARQGLYPATIDGDVRPARLRRFFTREEDALQVRPELRGMVIFSLHDILRDPPFSRLDLVVCRNVLIYLQRGVQQEVMELLHYALQPDGLLMLGSSETVGTHELFELEHKAARIYRRRNVPVREPRLPVFPVSPLPAPSGPRPRTSEEADSYAQAHRTLLERAAPPSLLLDADEQVVHLSETVGRYLVHPGGEPTVRAAALVRPELRLELQAALDDIRNREQPERTRPVPVELDGETRLVALDLRPGPRPRHDGWVLVLFHELGPPPPASAEPGSDDADPRVRDLATELDAARDRMERLVSRHRTDREEMRAANEELQSANEELRSTLEELETSREELQSMNEELQTVNQENRHKVAELAQLSADLRSLLAATDIATLFLDRELRILRFTPRVGDLFSVRSVDRGRPISELTHRLGYEGLERDARRVLDELVPVEREIADRDGRWYLTRIRPYRSQSDRIEGVVLTFVDVTDRKLAVQELRQSEEYAEKIVETLHEPLLVLEPDLRVHSANPAFYRHFGVDPADTVGRRIYDLGNGHWDIPELRELLESVLPENDVFLDYQVVHEFEDIGRRVMLVNGRRLDHVQLILLGIRDETDRQVAEEELREAERRFRTVANLVPDLLWRSRPDGWVTWCNQQWLDYTGQRPEDTDGSGWIEAIHPEDRVRARQVFEEARQARSRAETEHRLRRRDGAYRWFLFRGDPILGSDGEVEQWLGSATDVHAQREARDLLEARVDERTNELREKEAHLVRTTGVLQEEIAERKRAEDARDALSRRVLSAEEEERRRLSLELHDQMGQLLTALTLAVRNLEQSPEGEAIRGELETIRTLADQIGAEAHDVALVLQPPALDRLGLEASLAGHLEECCSLHGISCDFQSVGVEDRRFPRLVEITFYRVLQEGLTNVARHSEAGHVGLLLEYREGTLGLILEDDGRGFDPDRVLQPAADAGRLGLAGMRQRLALLRGTFEVESTPGGGTTLLARVQTDPVGEGEEGA